MWYKATCTIEMEIEASSIDSAMAKAETILEKRVIGQSFGFNRNDRGEVKVGWVDEISDDNELEDGE